LTNLLYDYNFISVIVSFGDGATEDLYHGVKSARARSIPASIVPVALRKLDAINAAHVLDDLRSPPGNRLEALKGNLSGYHSIRVNQQWRIVFRWEGNGAHEVRIEDYH
jgi:proteic killer suppression protein